jgi:hypothetical protein
MEEIGTWDSGTDVALTPRSTWADCGEEAIFISKHYSSGQVADVVNWIKRDTLGVPAVGASYLSKIRETR